MNWPTQRLNNPKNITCTEQSMKDRECHKGDQLIKNKNEGGGVLYYCAGMHNSQYQSRSDCCNFPVVHHSQMSNPETVALAVYKLGQQMQCKSVPEIVTIIMCQWLVHCYFYNLTRWSCDHVAIILPPIH
jgi:hypothetical protein